MEFSVFHDLQPNSKITIKDCFITNVFMYDFTYDHYIMHLRHLLRIHAEMMFLDYVNYILTCTNNSTHTIFPIDEIMKYEKPHNAVIIFKALISQAVLAGYEQSVHSLLPRNIKVIQFPSSSSSSNEDYFFMDLNENDTLYSVQFPTDEIENTAIEITLL